MTRPERVDLRLATATAKVGSGSKSEEQDPGVENYVEAVVGADQIVQKEDIPTGGVTSRLAAVNMDWDNIRAMDVMAVASSFTPSKGKVLQRVWERMLMKESNAN